MLHRSYYVAVISSLVFLARYFTVQLDQGAFPFRSYLCVELGSVLQHPHTLKLACITKVPQEKYPFSLVEIDVWRVQWPNFGGQLLSLQLGEGGVGLSQGQHTYPLLASCCGPHIMKLSRCVVCTCTV